MRAHPITAAAGFTLALLSFPLTGLAKGLPTREGTCVWTKIAQLEQRLQSGDQSAPGSGSAVSFTNGGYQVSYDQIDAVNQSRPGDAVLMCLVSIPRNCPPGDKRGRIYTTTNLRLGLSWTLADSQRSCGGG